MSPFDGTIPHGRSARRFAGLLRTTILVLRSEGGDHAPAHWTPLSGERLRDWVRGVGHVPGDMLSPALGHPGYAYPRNVEWKTLPVVGRPHFAKAESIFESLNDDGSLGCDVEWSPRERWRHPLAVLLASRYVVLDVPDLAPETMMQAVGPHLDAVRADAVEVVWFDGQDVVEVPEAAWNACHDHARIQDRLDYSLAFNLSVFVGRAARHVATAENWPMADLYWASMGPCAATGSLGIQILYDLDRVAQTGQSIMRADPHGDIDRTMIAPATVVEALRRYRGPSGHGTREAFVWMGTGIHAPLVQRLQDAAPDGSMAGMPRVFHALERLYVAGLVGLSSDGRPLISHAGRRVLEALGDGARDPDLPLRWLGRGDDAIPEIDRWLNRMLRIVKRRVAGYPAAARHEIGFDTLPNAHQRRHVVHGGWIAPGGDKAAWAGAFEEVAAYEIATPFLERTHGLIRSDARVNAPLVEGIWFGAPLAVAGLQRLFEMEATVLPDLERPVLEAKGAVDAIASRHGVGGEDLRMATALRLFTIGETSEPSAETAIFVPKSPETLASDRAALRGSGA